MIPAQPETTPRIQGFALRVHVRDGIDAGRDVCRLHTEAVRALGMNVWDPILLTTETTGLPTRSAAALVGFADWADPHDICIIDSFTAATLGVMQGSRIIAAPVAPIVAQDVWAAAGDHAGALPADMLRALLLGKAVLAGTNETLLPQDYNRAFTADAAGNLKSLRDTYGENALSREVTITRTQPGGVVLVAATTRVHWEGEVTVSSGPDTSVSLENIGGLDAQIAQITELFDLAFRQRSLLTKLGSTPCHGILLQGPVGSGKAELTYAIAAEFGATVVRISGVDLEFVDPNVVADRLKTTFSTHAGGTPVVILIEDVDRLASAKPDERAAGGAALLHCMDEVRDREDVMVVATTPNPDGCSAALFQPGRIDRRIDFPLPNGAQRLEILGIHTRPLPLAADVNLQELADKTHGFVGADIARLCSHAARAAAARLRTQPGSPESQIQVTAADFAGALEAVSPSALGGTRVDTGDVTWLDVGDAEATKEALTEAVIWPIKFPDTFSRLGLDPPRGVLLYGPPGCGKTFLVRALANEAAAHLISVKGAELLSKWVGESESGVRDVFRRARGAAPAVVFLDEIDALAPRRGSSTDSGVTDRVVAQLLTELDGIEPMRGVAVIGATNRPDLIDPALLRPGRLERHVFVEPPDAAARVEILLAAARKMPMDPDVDLAAVARGAAGFSAADLAALAREAGLTAMRRDPQTALITAADLEAAASRITPSVDAATVAALRDFDVA
ncbi:MAG: AAA family ATPase [Acidimicrobiia bacterium]|nr:AAA family ATPase [Acidimicrobiia bacterium]